MTVRLEAIAHGLVAPRSLVSPSEGSRQLFVIGQTGLVYVIDNNRLLLEELFLNLRGRVILPRDHQDPRGLINLAFHPNYVENGRLFVYYTAPLRPEAPPGWDHTVHVAEFSVTAENRNVVDLGSERVLFRFDLPNPMEAQLSFSSEGYLQVSIGDVIRPTFCLDVDLPDSPSVECPKEDNPPSNFADIDGQLRISSATKGTIPGLVYHGLAFPSFQGRYIFASNGAEGISVNPAQEDSRLYITSSPDLDGRFWKVEELLVSNWLNGQIDEIVRAIDQDIFGEIYILTSQNEDPRSQSGGIYKIVPHIFSERSIIDNPEEYLPAPFRYARLVRQAPVYRTLSDVRNNEPFGKHGGGNYWVTVRDQARVNGSTYYSVSWGWGNAAWVSASYLNMNAHLSSLSGVDMRNWQGEPLAMVYTAVHVRSLPGVIEDDIIISTLPPYSLVTILETRRVNGAVWYRIGPDQWSHSNYLRLLIPTSRPPDVGPREKWVSINLAEQTLIAYEGDKPVFATLTATGRRGLETEKGLYRTWAILKDGPMQWENVNPAYSLANVPWIMYFNRGQGLHGVYWHDLYGTVRSAGCVNLSPHDSFWIFNWAVSEFPEGTRVFYTSEDDPGLWVWVHDGRPNLTGQITAFQTSQINWPATAILPDAELLIKFGIIPNTR